MNSDFRISTTIFLHRKLIRLKRLTGPGAFEHLCRLWAEVARTEPSGRLEGWTVDDVEAAADWTGEAGAFCLAVVSVGWLDPLPDDTGFELHDWEEHQPWVVGAPKRRERAKKGAAARWDREVEGGEENAESEAREPEKQLPDEAVEISRGLAELLLETNPKHRGLKNGKREATVFRWADAVDKLNRLDGYTWEEIRGLVEWSQADPFWSTVILSGQNLRDKADQLAAQMKRADRKQERGGAPTAELSKAWREVRDAISRYGRARADKVPWSSDEIRAAVRACGGLTAFCNASEFELQGPMRARFFEQMKGG